MLNELIIHPWVNLCCNIVKKRKLGGCGNYNIAWGCFPILHDIKYNLCMPLSWYMGIHAHIYLLQHSHGHYDLTRPKQYDNVIGVCSK